ncbi:MAG: hypothetical protein CM1200mP5_6510 [Candidatus Pelagibacterales bacterium]|nr:MAG: hypothetical protein CM1200mP5_6510 [Pelagibacterales bacterium]
MDKNLVGKELIFLQLTDGTKRYWSFRRSKWFEAIKKECQNVKNNVGLLDMTAFAKCRIKGPKAEEFLDHLVANKLPQKKIWES